MAIDDAGTLLARLKLEGPATEADVVLGLDTNLMAQARASGLFAPHGVDTEGLDLPLPWSDDTFVPFDWGWFAFVYDSERLSEVPASFADLIADEDGPTIVIKDPRTSSPGLGLVLWMREIYGEAAADAWRKLTPRIITVTRGWSEAYGMFLAGEADMVLSYTTSPAYHLTVEDEDRYRAAVFAEGHAMQVEVAGIVASSDQPELARTVHDLHAERCLPVGDSGRQLDVPGTAPRGRPAGRLRRTFRAATIAADAARDGRRQARRMDRRVAHRHDPLMTGRRSSAGREGRVR